MVVAPLNALSAKLATRKMMDLPLVDQHLPANQALKNFVFGTSVNLLSTQIASVIHGDAPGIAIGAVLAQKLTEGVKPVAFTLRKLSV